ncbi:hypothetical protein SH2C18_10340 [Clostridium sediminicola]|uniref:DUF6414 family protein n=1 Tax=Clostridium sediminicola TaxID=3114879 RepID=UPI0031F1D869
MNENNAIIPLYLNTGMINNLFTVVIEKFSKTQSFNTKKQVVIKANTPLANVMPNSFCQGDFSFQFLDEFSKQKTEERVSIIIITLLKLKSILTENKLLKSLNTEDDINNIKEYDFIELNTELRHNPYIERINELEKLLQLQITFNFDGNDNKLFQSKREMLNLLKENMKEYKQSKCMKYITPELFGGKYKAIIPLDVKYMEDSLDYLEDSKITVLGKVIRVIDDKNSNTVNLLSRTCFDYLDDDYFLKLKKTYLNDTSMLDFKGLEKETDCSLLEIVPIAIYI